jgi:hypothetical protein
MCALILKARFAISLILTLIFVAIAHAAESLVVGRVAAVSAQRPVVALNVGADDGVHENDRVVILRDDGVVAAGTINHLQTDRCGLRFTSIEGRTPRVGDKVIVIRTGISPKPSDSCELVLFKSAAVDRVMPEGDRLWMAGGERDGWRNGDPVLVRRGSAVMGWGAATKCYENSALVELHRTREDGILPIEGDTVEAIGRFAGAGRVRSRVAAVVAAGGASRMFVAGDSRTGFGLDDRVEIIRNGQYISYAKVVGVDPFLQIEATDAFQRSSPQEGDAVVRRGDADGGHSAIGRIFRVEKDYALITLGQVDQIELGQRLFILNPDGSTTPLTVTKTYAEHCGAKLDAPNIQTNNSTDEALDDYLKEWKPVATFSGAAARRVVSCAEPLAQVGSDVSDWLATFEPEGYCLPKEGETVAGSRDGDAWLVIAVHPDEIVAVKVASDEF